MATLDQLIEKLGTGTLSEAERRELASLLHATDADEARTKLVQLFATATNLQQLDAARAAGMLEAITGEGLDDAAPVVSMPVHSRDTRIHFLKRMRWVAAAIFIGLMAVTGWWVMRERPVKTPVVAVTRADVPAPASNRATITRAGGQTIYLDQAANGQLARLGNIQLSKLGDGRIVYAGNSDKAELNTVNNPKGSKVIDLVLVDGSHVWLNAGSSITYPVPFTGAGRNVSITGEAYFEVAHNAAKPFVVTKGETSVQVLGTHFNVKAYDDEEAIKVTLLEGSVKVNKGVANDLLLPGEQAEVNQAIRINRNINLEQVMAWKNGLFIFQGADIKSIMRELARWYDLDVVYEGEVKPKFYVKTSRNSSMSNILKILEKSGGIHIRINGKQVLVAP